MGVAQMTRSLESRVRRLRIALHEAWKAGDTQAVKRLTKRVADLIAQSRTMH